MSQAAVTSEHMPPHRVATATAPLVDIRGLEVDFPGASDSKRVLKGVSLSVQPGEIIGLVGESGAGKTTLARSILGVPPAPGKIVGGEVVFEGRNILALPEPELRKLRGRRLSVVVPNPRAELNPTMTIGRQIAAMAQIHLGVGRKEALRLALGILRDVQIPDPERRMNAYPHELSGGMAQRVVIAMALICNPAFIISDDATSGLDVTVQSQILSLLGRLAADHGSAMLFITRDIGITAHFCDRVAVLYGGEIMELAPREDLFLRPAHPYTLMLLAAFSHSPALRDAWSVPETGRRRTQAKGCHYAGRCPIAQPVCSEKRPPFAEISPGHFALCHFPVSHE
ncbi:ABC transporter ATP-binding protein [Labrys monachus]|uniref:Oligopeptide/dipeptide ABC transporter ATP-binding protein n=1 Tax=Labrys monachus TaxID=217067 RepID=A0ABU0FPF1_9HYPH|nr:ABC transporter ATP-binding protein [Labrys monachus]MDQ0396493.1 oligopeptide/dipeptide ABC transporter ATP-binding protein [Labrys monachus]